MLQIICCWCWGATDDKGACIIIQYMWHHVHYIVSVCDIVIYTMLQNTYMRTCRQVNIIANLCSVGNVWTIPLTQCVPSHNIQVYFLSYYVSSYQCGPNISRIAIWKGNARFTFMNGHQIVYAGNCKPWASGVSVNFTGEYNIPCKHWASGAPVSLGVTVLGMRWWQSVGRRPRKIGTKVTLDSSLYI